MKKALLPNDDGARCDAKAMTFQALSVRFRKVLLPR